MVANIVESKRAYMIVLHLFFSIFFCYIEYMFA